MDVVSYHRPLKLRSLCFLQYRRAGDSSQSAWFKGRRPPGAVLYSSREQGELSQWLSHDDSKIKIVLRIITTTTIIIINIPPVVKIPGVKNKS